MEEKSSFNASGEEKEESKPLTERIVSIIRSNWIALSCALAITVLAIIVIPIVYTLKETPERKNSTTFAWDINGTTIINQSTLLIGVGNESLGLISSLFIDGKDQLYILDKTNHRLLTFQLQEEKLQILVGHEDGSSGSDASSFNSPNDIYISSKSEIYIADTLNHRIQRFPESSTQGETVFGTGQAGSALNQLSSPMSMTMDDQSVLYIADYGNNRVLAFNTSSKETLILIPPFIPPAGMDRNRFITTPISIKYSRVSLSLFIAQEQGYNIAQWYLKGNGYWNLIAGSASSELNGTSRTLFNKVCHVNIDVNGDVSIGAYEDTYVTDCENQRIQYYRGYLTKGRTIAGVVQAPGNNSYIFNYSTSTALDLTRNLYVADAYNYRIQRFTQLF